jgi:hypothetical protein
MDARCYICKKKIKYGEDVTSINKGNYSEEGDKDWIALIFHDACWERLGKTATGKIAPIFQAEA